MIKIELRKNSLSIHEDEKPMEATELEQAQAFFNQGMEHLIPIRNSQFAIRN
ncbi:hypothetical protein NSMS1_63710 (plasmid) [Nostoc sp. MS1]|nr:hypothetical protein NSMS1_63710 [Nostoc sp. MS1]